MMNWGNVPLGAVIPFKFPTYAGATGASITMTGFAVTDIEVYSGTSMTQRASDSGVVLLDTDGIDLDGATGIQGFSIDTSDNADAGFYAAGSFYTVVVASVTVDGQVVNLIAGTFRLVPTEASVGMPKVDVAQWLGVGVAGTAGIPNINVSTIINSATDLAGMATNVAQVHSRLGTPANLGGGATVAGNLSDIEGQTDDIGAAGAGLTALPDMAGVTTLLSRLSAARALLLDEITAARLSELDAGTPGKAAAEIDLIKTDAAAALTRLPTTLVNGRMDASVGAMANNVLTAAAINAAALTAAKFAAGAIDAAALATDAAQEIADAVKGRQLAESYAADGVAPTLEQAIMGLQQFLQERIISGTTLTVRKLDGTTAAMTFTLSDASNPVSLTRAA